MKRIIAKNKNVVIILTLLFFILSNYSIYSNLHVHNIYSFNIVHGHPYQHHSSSGGKTPSHTHSKSEFLFYASLFNVSVIFLLILFIFILFQLHQSAIQPEKSFHYVNPFLFAPFMRAPPF